MPRPSSPLVLLAAAFAFVVAIIIAGGAAVRGTVGASYAAQNDARVARVDLDAILTAQLDEETGIRGYAATGERLFLEPYEAAHRLFPARIAALGRALRRIGAGDDADVDALAGINARWNAAVAVPVIAGTDTDPTLVQRRGKALVDRYRASVARIAAVVVRRREAIAAAALAGIARINLYITLATLLIIVIAVVFLVRQRLLERRLERERHAVAEARAAYETERRISQTLQEAFMLKPLPKLPRVQLSAIYVPATQETLVGGDWYDGIELDEHRVMFAIGDVAGHGLEAAVAMNRTRQALLTAALAGDDPAGVLSRVNDELIRERGRMVTAVCGYADAAAFRFIYATAGHPPPILIEPGREPRLLAFGGVPLAVMPEAKYRSHTVQSVPGAMLVLYTDGAVEHSRDVLAGEKTLLHAVRDAIETSAEDPAGHIRESIFRNRKVADDVAIVTLTFAAGPPAEGRLRLVDRIEVSAAGPDAAPGAVTSIAGASYQRRGVRRRSA